MNVNDEMELKVGSHVANVGAISAAGIAYLLAYGFRQSVQDVIAGKAKAMRDETVAEDDEEAKALGLEVGQRRWSDAEITTALHDLQTERVAAILDGSIGMPRSTGPRGSALDTIMRAVAVERLKAKLGKFKVALPTGDKTLTIGGKAMTRDDIIEAELAKYGDEIKAEAERRQEASKALRDATVASTPDGELTI